MLKQTIRLSFSQHGLLLQIILGVGLGGLLGLLCISFSPFLALGVLLSFVLVYIVLKRPEVGLLMILVATSSIVFEGELPLIPIGNISLNIPDIFLLLLFGLILLRWWIEPEFRIIRTPLDWPILLFYGMMILSTSIAVFQSSMQIEPARREIRIVTYYLTFFIVTNLIRERRQLNLLLNGFFLLAAVVAAAIIVQFALGTSMQILPGRVENLGTMGAVYSDVTRILPPGWSIILVSFVTTVCILSLEKLKPAGLLKYLLFGLFGFALLVTFLRSYWAALIIALGLLAFILRENDRQRFIVLGIVTISTVAMLVLLAFIARNSKAQSLVNASIDRLGTLFNGGTYQGQDNSINTRMIENTYAISAFVSHPWVGIGMGAVYRPLDWRLDSPSSSLQTLIENGHLELLTDTGVLGYLTFLSLSFIFLYRGLRNWRGIADPWLKGIVLGFSLVYLIVLIAAVTNSSFTQWRWTPVLGVIMGVNEVILRLEKQKV